MITMRREPETRVVEHGLSHTSVIAVVVEEVRLVDIVVEGHTPFEVVLPAFGV